MCKAFVGFSVLVKISATLDYCSPKPIKSPQTPKVLNGYETFGSVERFRIQLFM